MRRCKSLKKICGTLIVGMVFGCTAAWARPVEILPVVVKGKLAPYSRVKKHNRIWYPASVVGLHRGVTFSYDYATGKLYADGVETYIQSVVVDDVVYLNMTPEVSQQEMRPGMSQLHSRQADLRAFESASPHMEGNTDAIFMSQNVPNHEHPWAHGAVDLASPIIDLDPTYEVDNAPLLRPGARPPEAPPENLPSRLPRPGEEGLATNENGTIQVVVPQGPQGMPRTITTEGGPAQADSTASPVDTAGLQPIPVQPTVAPDTSPFTSSGKLRASSSHNSVFKVDILAGDWELGVDSILRLKLSQTNLSKVAQSNLGSFAVRCTDGSRVEASRTRSYLPDGTLAPGGLREGEMVFRLASGQKPRALELEGALGLSVPLQQI